MHQKAMYVGTENPNLKNKVGRVVIDTTVAPMVIFVLDESGEEYRVRVESLSFLSVPETRMDFVQ